MPPLPKRDFALSRPSTWAAILLGATFLAIGAAFMSAPGFGAWLFGIYTEGPIALAYVRALGFRDVALALYIFGLLAFGTARTLSLVLACSLVIPALDVILVWHQAGNAALVQIAVHLAGAFALLTVAAWLRSDAPPGDRRSVRPDAT